MYDRDRHVGKTLQEKSAYSRYIRTLDYEPTLDEALTFPSTERGGEELSESSVERHQRGRSINLILEHLKDHWTEWVMCGLVVIGLYLINESRVTMAILGKTVEDESKKVESIQGDLKVLNQKLYSIELQGVRNSKDIEYLMKK